MVHLPLDDLDVLLSEERFEISVCIIGKTSSTRICLRCKRSIISFVVSLITIGICDQVKLYFRCRGYRS